MKTLLQIIDENEAKIKDDKMSQLILSTSRDRLRILAGIIKNDTMAMLSTPHSKDYIQLKHVPNWWERLKYKACGMNVQIVREK